MSFVINTNTMSLIAQQNLNESQKSLNSAIERLSSGSKINSAKDDAAGQAISNRMTAQINGLMQASSNANDGISLAQTTEGALNQVNDNLQRVRELSVQAANGLNSQSDLESIQGEINQALSEINRISEQTAFNGTTVLDGSKTSIDIQVGANDDQTITINLAALNAETLGLDGFNVTNAVTSDDLGTDIADGSTVSTTTTAITIAGDDGTTVVTSDGNLYEDDAGNYFVKDDSSDTFYAADVTDPAAVSFNSDDGAATPSSSPVEATAVDVEVTADTSALTADQSLNEIVDADGTGTGEYIIKDTSGDVPVYYEANVAADGVVTQGDEATVDPLAALDNALKSVDDLRSDLGAVQNRLDSAISNISTTTINLSSARSRIVDADYAVEVSNLSKAQILQQAGTSVLAQANQTSQGVLSLLR